MSGGLLQAIMSDLEAWAPHLEPCAREALARRCAERLTSRHGLAEHRLGEGRSISWLFDARSGQLLATYPDGAHRIRVVAPPIFTVGMLTGII